jgi:uncharacterized membrane protein YdjX (TVP38/TMEM64 family)
MRRARLPLVVLVVGGLVWLVSTMDVGQHASLEGVRALVDAYHPYGPFVFTAVCAAGIFLYLPEIVLIALGAMAFAPVLAFACGWIGCVIGTTGTFLLGRHFAREHFQRLLHRRFARLRALDERLERNGFGTVLVLRLVLFLAPPLNWGLGATRVRAHHYVGGTALGIAPGIAATVFFADAITSGTAPVLSPGVVTAAIALLALIAAAALASRRILGGRRA